MSDTSKKKRSKKKIDTFCNTCDADIQSNKSRDALRFNDDDHQVLALEQCDDHEYKYTNHKCTPHWCGDCGFLIKYEIILTDHIDKSVDE